MTFWDCIEQLVIQDLKLLKKRVDDFRESFGEEKIETTELDKFLTIESKKDE